MNRKRTLWITTTAIFIALLVTTQHVTAAMSQFVTGSIVNFILVAATILVGVSSGIVIGVISPILAFLIIGRPLFPMIVPFIMLGNVVQVITVYVIARKVFDKINWVAYTRMGAAVIVSSVLKFVVVWVGVVHIALPFLIPQALPPQVAMMSTMFSWPQLVTALIGSTTAMAVMPQLMRALRISR